MDACSDQVVKLPRVDLYISTPNCEMHSRRNHSRTLEGRSHSLEDVWASLAYVRANWPEAVVMENVYEVTSVGFRDNASRGLSRATCMILEHGGARRGAWGCSDPLDGSTVALIRSVDM